MNENLELIMEKEKLLHYMIEIFGISQMDINDPSQVSDKVQEIVEALRLRVVKSISHKFSPQGLTFAFILSSSHLIVHTWPEYNYLHIDLFCCSDLPRASQIEELIKNKFECDKVDIRRINYG